MVTIAGKFSTLYLKVAAQQEQAVESVLYQRERSTNLDSMRSLRAKGE